MLGSIPTPRPTSTHRSTLPSSTALHLATPPFHVWVDVPLPTANLTHMHARAVTQASTAPISNDHDRPAYDPNVVHARDSAISCLADVNKPPTHQMGPFKDWTPPAKE